jgi:exodeoxyribonuclease-3
MLIATWNVNSIRVRLPRVVEWLDALRPDVLCMQETKVVDEEFPHAAFEKLGYEVATFGQKTYNGVAIASRLPMADVSTGLPGEGPDDQKRVIEATIDGVRVVNLYVVNGKAPGTEHFERKMEWLSTLRKHLDDSLSPEEDVVVLGDINITPDDRDVYDPGKLEGTIHCTAEERAALQNLLDFGLTDAHRLHHDGDGVYSWWDFRGGMFQRGLGLRIDLIMVTKGLAERCRMCEVDKTARDGEKPSDHAPVLAKFI